nr:CinA family nicotinamide mononucleotide deamidase-related protein [Vibrio agarilyticus]
MLSTGEEVLHGDIVDTNAAWLGSVLFENGFGLTKRATVGDNLAPLVEELLMLSFNNDVVIVNGGLGPTSDDLTAEAAAQAADEPLTQNAHWVERMQTFFASRGKEMPTSNLKQALLPASATMIDNPIGTACGFQMMLNDAVFYFTPGVPREFKKMVEGPILSDLKARFPNVMKVECSRLYTFGLSESGISQTLADVSLPADYQLGYRSYLPFIEVKVFGPAEPLETRIKVVGLIHRLLEQNVVSIDETMLVHIGHRLDERALTLSTAEIASNGYLTAWLKSESRINARFGPAWVLSEQQNHALDDSDPLAAALALAGATREKCQTDLALVVGKLHDNQFTVALSAIGGEWGMILELTREYEVSDRNKLMSAVAADLLRRFLEKKPMFGQYGFLNNKRELFIPNSLVK